MGFVIMFFTALPILIGCVDSSKGDSAAVAPTGPASPIADVPPSDDQPPVPQPQPSPSPSPAPQTVDITYYSMSLTEAPVTGWSTKTYTAIGSCVVYLNNTYCWDDGVHTLEWTSNNNHFGPFEYTYWGLMQSSNQSGYSLCHGGCTTDYLTQPTYISAALTTTLTSQAISGVLTHGTPTTVTCLKSDTELNCGSVVIEL